ncbi:winged helix-turn-helix transcriptional regulator [Pseudoalteromonas sp. MMG010]|uniref:winged helix-turn-helix transcriptional regulator n=1 Tax=Pseudoalteromonas sp. MMG010 TaxID=2822685 RepID=UPI001B3A646A|nr:winged helix-turn-helix transcriptional regulator [Pseudoalteromonas sp. MMG010]MBQ4833957.1 winged helix-turn-helix transcriptional regulator [Pseudoalteromonas sp. MMG010]
MSISSRLRMLDRIDLAILEVLQSNGRISNVNLAKQVNLSPSPCLDRVKRLEQEGYIEGYCAKLSEAKLNQSLLAHVQVSLVSSNTAVFKVFRERILKIKQVVECDMVAGGYDYLLKIRVSDMDEYREVLGDLVDIPGVGTHHSYMVIEKIKQDSGLRLDN